MIVVCQNCSSNNRIPEGANPADFLCGNCGMRTLLTPQQYSPPTSGTFITSAAVGAGVGGLLGGPGGALLGAAAGALVAGATGMQGKQKKEGGSK